MANPHPASGKFSVPPLPPTSRQGRRRGVFMGGETRFGSSNAGPVGEPTSNRQSSSTRSGARKSLRPKAPRTPNEADSNPPSAEILESKLQMLDKLSRRASVPSMPTAKAALCSTPPRRSSTESRAEASDDKKVACKSSPFGSPLRDSTNDSPSIDHPNDNLQGSPPRKKRTLRRVDYNHVSEPTFSGLEDASGDGVEDESCDVSKRRRRRQSMVLPWSHGEAPAVREQTLRTDQAEQGLPGNSKRSSEAVQDAQAMAVELAQIRTLLKEYECVPPLYRAQSKPATMLADLTDYPLESAYAADYAETVSVDSSPTVIDHAVVARCMSQLDFAVMDACKIADSRIAEEETGCTAERAFGVYRYFHKPSGRYIEPSEYERRYLSMLKSVEKEESQQWEQYFDELKCASSDLRNGNGSNKLDEASIESVSLGADAYGPAYRANEEATTGCTAPPSPPFDDAQVTAEGWVPNGVKATVRDNDTPTIAVQDGDAATEEATVMQRDTSEPETPEIGISLPSRDTPSSDPEIAEAERKLFRDLDRALEQYSRDIEAIRERRRLGGLSA